MNAQQHANDTVAALDQFSERYFAIIAELKFSDVDAMYQLALTTHQMAVKAGIHSGTMLEAANRERMAIMNASSKVIKSIDGVVSGVMHWADYAEADATLKALAYPQSADGKLRARFQELPCFKQTTEFYNRVQALVDTLAIHATPASSSLN